MSKKPNLSPKMHCEYFSTALLVLLLIIGFTVVIRVTGAPAFLFFVQIILWPQYLPVKNKSELQNVPSDACSAV